MTALHAATQLDADVPYYKDRKTRIVCTIGPATSGRLTQLLLAGCDVARINCAHGGREEYARVVSSLHAAVRDIRSRDLKASDVARADVGVVALAFDIKGPEIRTGSFSDVVPPTRIAVTDDATGAVTTVPGPKEINLKRGDELYLTSDPAHAACGTREMVYVKYPSLTAHVAPGSVIFIDDGNVELRVLSVHPSTSTVRVVSHSNAPLGERKGVNLPGVDVDLPTISPKDEVDLATAMSLGADIIFASFIRTASQVEEIRARCAPGVHIIAKIEDHRGMANFDSIVAASDGIMVARGDLGVQIPPERVFLAQKRMVARANVAGKPVICATQMLDSMTTHARPTRAECVDVANAVTDGADAVMLSQETAKGRYPIEAVSMMSRICQAAEAAYNHRAFFNALADMSHHTGGGRPGVWAPSFVDGDAPTADMMTSADLETLASSAVHAALEVNAAFIMVASVTGTTAAYVAKYRPPCPILCLTSDEGVARRMQLRRGVQAAVVSPNSSIADIKARALAIAVSMGIARSGDRFVAVHGQKTMPNQGGVQVSLGHVK